MTAVFPLGSAFLPGERVALNVFESRYLAMFSDIKARGEHTFVSVLIERGSEVGGGDRRFDTGVRIQIESVSGMNQGLTVSGAVTGVVKVVNWGQDCPWPNAVVTELVWEENTLAERRDCASALTLLAQSLRSLLERHGIGPGQQSLPHGRGLAAVASGSWFGPDADPRDLQRAYWGVCRCVPCGPLDRHTLLGVGSAPHAVRTLRAVVEHTDEILSFSR